MRVLLKTLLFYPIGAQRFEKRNAIADRTCQGSALTASSARRSVQATIKIGPMATAVPVAARDVARPRHSPATNGKSENIGANSVWKVKLPHCKKCPKCGKNKRARTRRQSSESSESSLSVSSKDSGKHDRSKFKAERSAVVGTKIQICSGDVERAAKTLESWQADLKPRRSSRKAAPRGSAKVGPANNKSKKSQSLGNLTGRESVPMRPLPPELGAGNLATAFRASAARE